MMLRHLGLVEHSDFVETGLKAALAAGIRTVDLTQIKGMKPASTDAFADAIIKHMPPQATSVSISIPAKWSTFVTEKEAIPEMNEKLFTKRSIDEKTVGMDIFVDSNLDPPTLAEKVKSLIPKTLKLVMISNRGTQVWPTGSTFTQVVNHFRCRLEPISKGEEQDESELLKVASSVSEGGVRVCSLEMLRCVDGQNMFTLAQGQ